MAVIPAKNEKMKVYTSISGIENMIRESSREEIIPTRCDMRVAISMLMSAVNIPIDIGKSGETREKVRTKKIFSVNTNEAIMRM